ncbi:MAG: CARDB domain-containing protein, partial [Candidatus Brocadiia bacterium]
LSNNHVFALENAAATGSKVLQPGLYDTDCTFDESNLIGTLADFEPIVFDGQTENTMDAAVAATSVSQLGTATPADGYGTPSSQTVAAQLGQQVMKYGRTTNLTYGEVTGLNATVKVGYNAGTALFVGQIIVESRKPCIKPGDSGSLLVTEAGSNPVGLLFAGNDPGKLAVANPIGPVLARFNVTVDASAPSPVTDVAITGVSAPSAATTGTTVDVNVTVANVGNQDVGSDIGVTLTDQTDAAIIGTQTVSGGLVPGASATLTFTWDTTGASLGDHVLAAAHDFADDNGTNDSDSATVNVTEESALAVTGIVPETMPAGGTVAVEISGAGFAAGAQVVFEGGNGPAPEATVDSLTDTSIGATVAAKSGGPPRNRVWDVRVTNPDGSSAVLADGFTVTP